MIRAKRNFVIIVLVIVVATIVFGMSSTAAFLSNNGAVNGQTLLGDKIGGYTTYYSDSPDTRAHNIELAAKKINSTLVMPMQTITFNTLVGDRTIERGFQEANIIVDGEFKAGVGGGVCQVSSTLYNAWLTSGLEVVSARAHSLPVSYIPMSRDATVSRSIDLVLKNNFSSPVLITTKCENMSIAISIFGKASGYEYNVVTKVIKELAPAPPEIIYDSALSLGYEEVIKQPRAGYITYAKIQTFKGGKMIAETKLREDTYQPVRAKLLRGGQNPEQAK